MRASGTWCLLCGYVLSSVKTATRLLASPAQDERTARPATRFHGSTEASRSDGRAGARSAPTTRAIARAADSAVSLEEGARQLAVPGRQQPLALPPQLFSSRFRVVVV